MKCKERMCGRAQLEIMRLTEELVARFAKNKQNLSSANRRRLEDLLEDDKPCARCGYRDFQCVEGCKWGKDSDLPDIDFGRIDGKSESICLNTAPPSSLINNVP